MWFVYPDLPTGPSRARNFMAMEEAKHTAVEEFENNVAHSYVKVNTVIAENMKDFKSINIGLRGEVWHVKHCNISSFLFILYNFLFV